MVEDEEDERDPLLVTYADNYKIDVAHGDYYWVL